jgi:hypothetical protein
MIEGLTSGSGLHAAVNGKNELSPFARRAEINFCRVPHVRTRVTDEDVVDLARHGCARAWSAQAI